MLWTFVSGVNTVVDGSPILAWFIQNTGLYPIIRQYSSFLGPYARVCSTVRLKWHLR